MKTLNNFSMTTKNQNGINYKKTSSLFFAILILGLGLNAQQFHVSNEIDYFTYKKGSVDNIINPDFESLDHFYFIKNIEHKYSSIQTERELTSEQLFDDVLNIEPWMTDSNNFEEYVPESELPNDKHLFIEPWMVDSNLFNICNVVSDESDEKLYIEDWMLHQEYFSSTNVLAGLNFEASMSNK